MGEAWQEARGLNMAELTKGRREDSGKCVEFGSLKRNFSFFTILFGAQYKAEQCKLIYNNL